MIREKKIFAPAFAHIYKKNSSAKPYFFWYEPKTNNEGFYRRKYTPQSIPKFENNEQEAEWIKSQIRLIRDSNFLIGKKKIFNTSDKLFELVASKTIDTRSKNNLNQALYVLQEFWKKNLLSFKPTEVVNFQDWMRIKKKYSPTTTNRKTQDLHNIFQMAVRRKIIKENPFKDAEKIKEKRNGYLPFKKQEILYILNFIKPLDFDLYMQCCIAYYTMARPNELRQIKIIDLDFDDGLCFINQSISKTEQRNCKIPSEFINLLKSYVKDVNPHNYLFGLEPKPLVKNAVTKKFNTIIHKKLNYSPRYSFYSWKYTGGKEYYLQSYDLLGTMNQMGHSNPNTTWIYLKRIGIKDLRGLDNHKLPI